MLSGNIKTIRKSEGLSREGMSVPDAGLRIALSGALESPSARCSARQPSNPPPTTSKPSAQNWSASMHIRFAPIILIAALIGIFLTWKKR